MSEIILEIPKVFLQETFIPRQGANSFSNKLLHYFLEHYKDKTLILLTDATEQEFEIFKASLDKNRALVHATYSNLEEIISKYKSIEFTFISDLNIVRFLKFRNYFKLKVPVIGLIHALGTRDHIQTLENVAKNLSSIDCLICPSKSTERTVYKLADKLDLPILKETTQVINHGIDCTHFSPSDKKAKVRKELGINEDQIVLLNVSRINPYTKMDIIPLIDNIKSLKTRYPNILLLIVGSIQVQDYYDEVKSYVKKHDLEENIRFIKNPNPPFNQYFQVGDMFVSVIDNSIETFGLSVVEAMASELPVVISRFGPYLELIENNKEGVLIPTYMFKGKQSQLSKEFAINSFIKFGDTFTQSVAVDNNKLREALSFLIENPKKRREMGKRGREKAKAYYSHTLMMQNYIRCFERQVELKKKGPITFNKGDRFEFDELFLHFSENILDSNITLYISDRGKKVLLEEETLLMFMRHKMQYPYLPQIINILNRGDSNIDKLSQQIGVEIAELSGDIMYLLKHDLIMTK